MTPYTIVFDFETGGVETHHPSIQLAAIAVDARWQEVDSFNQKIAFAVEDCQPEALALNHYTPEAWADAVHPTECAALFTNWLGPYMAVEMISQRGRVYHVAQMAGYHTDFDKPRLKQLYGQLFMPCSYLMRCVLQRVLWYFEERGHGPVNYKLASVAEHLGLDAAGAHDALADVRLTAAVYRAIRTRKVTP